MSQAGATQARGRKSNARAARIDFAVLGEIAVAA